MAKAAEKFRLLANFYSEGWAFGVKTHHFVGAFEPNSSIVTMF
jgi:hypothetical protein